MSKTALIADIGGTNARFGLVDENGLQNLKTYRCNDFKGPVQAAEKYLADMNVTERPEIGVFTVAGPVMEDLVSFTNIPWKFKASTVKADMGFAEFEVMNDFKAVALAVPAIRPELLRKIGGGTVVPERAIGVIGPGTGLGVASLIWSGNRYIANPCEGGHVTMPATNQREFDIFQTLRVKYHHISAERVCSGKGLENLYNAIRALDRKFEQPDLTAEEISAAAMNGSCEICKESLDLMLAFLGRIAGNLALTLNAHGGIYIAGGIPSKLGEFFYQSRFIEEFQAKGRFRDFMEEIPAFVIQHDAIGLLGLESHAKLELGY
jgi:glucokinase